MTNFEGMHSYFWLCSSRLREPVQDHVPYTTKALRQDLLRIRNAWEESQASRDRDAIYGYLTAVFNLVAWWTVAQDVPIRRRGAICRNHSLHRRSGKGRQAHEVEMVTRAAVCAGVQIEF
jgi:hypothetical protein